MNDFEVFEPSDSVAIYSTEPGVVRSLPVRVRRSADSCDEYVVSVNGLYVRAELIPGFLRYEKLPRLRPKRPDPRLPYIPPGPGIPTSQNEPDNFLERLTAKQLEWNEQTRGAN
jgi:hypothetical protein